MVANRDSVQQPLNLSYAFAQPPEQMAALGTSYVRPLCDFGVATNPQRAEHRAFPVDFGFAQEDTLVVTLTLPPGYELAEMPKPPALSLPDGAGRSLCSVTATGTTAQLSSRLTLRKPVYPMAEYASLR